MSVWPQVSPATLRVWCRILKVSLPLPISPQSVYLCLDTGHALGLLAQEEMWAVCEEEAARAPPQVSPRVLALFQTSDMCLGGKGFATAILFAAAISRSDAPARTSESPTPAFS